MARLTLLLIGLLCGHGWALEVLFPNLFEDTASLPTTPTTTAATGWIANARGENLHTYTWGDMSVAPAAVFFVSHGFAEHMGYYEDLAVNLGSLNVLIVGHDHVGHGKSDGTRAHIKDFSYYADDIVQHIKLLKQVYPSAQMVAIGQSMGGLALMEAVLDEPNLVDGLVLSAPLLQVPDNLLGIAAAATLGLVLPLVPTVPLNTEVFTRNETMYNTILGDELFYRDGIRTGWALQSIKAINSLVPKAQDITVPIAIIHGSADTVNPLQGSQDLLDNLGSSIKSLSVINDAYHHLFIELEATQAEAAAAIVAFLGTLPV